MSTAEAATLDWSEELEHSEAVDAVMAVAARMYELNAILGDFLQIHVIVDTNIIYSDLLAIVRAGRRAGRKRPAILELLAKRTLIGYFPQERIAEVHAKCVELSTRYSVPVDEVTTLWVEYQKHLNIVSTHNLERERLDTRTLAARDESDVPFVQARHIVGASVILSNDADLRASGAPVMPWSRVPVDLRHFSRKQGLRAAVFLGTGTVIVIPILALIGCVKLIHNASKNIPRQALIVAAVGLGIALLIPQSRKFLIDAGKAALTGLKKVGAAVGPVIGDTYLAAAKAEARAKEMRPPLEKQLARALKGRLTLAQAIYRACLLGGQPMLTVAEV